MPIVYGANITEDDLREAKTPVLNVVAGYPPTVGAGCYPIPMYPYVPQVYPAPLPLYWVNRYQTVANTVGNPYLFNNPASTYTMPMYSHPGTAYPPLPTFWLGRPRAATTAPLTTPFPVTNLCGPRGTNGLMGVSVSRVNTPFVWGVSGPPFVQAPPLDIAQAINTTIKLANGDWDGALSEVGINDTAPVNLLYNLPLSRYDKKDNEITLLVTSPRPRPHACGRMAKRLGYILSDMNPDFVRGYNVTVGEYPVIDADAHLGTDDFVSLKEMAIATGIMLSGVTDPALIDASMYSQTLNNLADKALCQAAQKAVMQGAKHENLTFSQTVDGSIVVSGAKNTTGGLADIFVGIANAVKDVAPTVIATVDMVSKGQANVADLASAAQKILPAVSTAAAAFGQQDIARVASKLNTNIASGRKKVEEAMNLLNSLADKKDIKIEQLGHALQEVAQNITKRGQIPRELLEIEDLVAQAAAAADIERRRRRQPKLQKKSRKSKRRRQGVYSKVLVNKIIKNIEYIANNPEDLIDLIEEALDQEIAEKDVVKALNLVLKNRLGYIQQQAQYQAQEFQDESKLLSVLRKRLNTAKSKRSAMAILDRFLRGIKRYY